jgi:hypothetical protein
MLNIGKPQDVIKNRQGSHAVCYEAAYVWGVIEINTQLTY